MPISSCYNCNDTINLDTFHFQMRGSIQFLSQPVVKHSLIIFFRNFSSCLVYRLEDRRMDACGPVFKVTQGRQ